VAAMEPVREPLAASESALPETALSEGAISESAFPGTVLSEGAAAKAASGGGAAKAASDGGTGEGVSPAAVLPPLAAAAPSVLPVPAASPVSVAPSKSRGPEAPERTPSRFFFNWPAWLARFYGLYSKLVGFRFEGYPFDLEGPCIFTVWHSEEVSLLPRFGFSKGAIIISNSKDGDILTGVVSRWGYQVIRGSSSKGAVRAVLSLKKALEDGQNVIMAVDGPRGPRHEAKPGAYYLAAKTGRPICPLGGAVSRAHVFERSWSKSRLPLPFSRVAASFGDLIWLEKSDLAVPQDEQRAFLTAAMDRAMVAAGRLLESWPGNCSNLGQRQGGPD
jgi:lysophospholipid acyltransferase (LPLAT)-like uncharacterized protein